MTAKWEILIPTLGERAELFHRLMTGLLPQVDSAGGQVRVTGWWNHGQPSLPVIRQQMVAASTASYVCFIDDDDVVSPDYVERILAALESGPDYVGFQVQCYVDGRPTAISHHDLRNARWINQPGRYLRDISHLNPIRTQLARSADFRRSPRGGGEDRIWAEQLRRSGRVRTQEFIPEILYHYLQTSPSSPTGSRWRNPRMIRPGGTRPVLDSDNFSWSDHA